jgi:hypothetical protein
MTRAHLSALTAWGPLPICVVAPLTPINLRAADSESDAGLVLPLRNGKLPSLFCTNEDRNTRYHPGHPFVYDGERSWMPNAKSVSERPWQMSRHVRLNPGSTEHTLGSRPLALQELVRARCGYSGWPKSQFLRPHTLSTLGDISQYLFVSHHTINHTLSTSRLRPMHL